MSKKETQSVWLFRFGLEGEAGAPIRRALAEALLDRIIEWAEENECQIGGGYRPPAPDER